MSFMRVLAIPATAGNVTYNIQPGAGRRWRIHSMMVSLTTDATVADRRIRIHKYDNPSTSNETQMTVYGTTRAASGSTSVGIGPVGFLSSATLGGAHAGVAYPIDLDVSMSLTVSIEAGVAGDSFTGFVHLEEEPTGT